MDYTHLIKFLFNEMIELLKFNGEIKIVFYTITKVQW